MAVAVIIPNRLEQEYKQLPNAVEPASSAETDTDTETETIVVACVS